MKHQKRWKLFFTLSLFMTILLVGCDGSKVEQPTPATPTPSTDLETLIGESSYNSVFEEYNNNITELGLIINEPTEEALKSLLQKDTYKQAEDIKENILIIPKYNESKVTISTVEYTGERFITKETLYTKEMTPEGYGLQFYAMRPEGIPQFMITITYKNKSVNYLLQTNGKDGNEGIEYLTLEPEVMVQDDLSELIIPVQEATYLEGLNRFSRYEIDLDLDGVNEAIEVYCDGEQSAEGYPLLDDGQEWALIVRKGEMIYPLFERAYIQLGGLDYQVYIDYSDNDKVHILINYQSSASLMNFDCVYDTESGNFKRSVTYQADDVSILKEWHWG